MKLMDLLISELNKGKSETNSQWTRMHKTPVQMCANGCYKDIKTGKFIKKEVQIMYEVDYQYTDYYLDVFKKLTFDVVFVLEDSEDSENSDSEEKTIIHVEGSCSKVSFAARVLREFGVISNLTLIELVEYLENIAYENET